MDRKAIQEKAKQQIDELFAKIDQLEQQRADADATIRSEYEDRVAALKARRKDLQERYHTMQTAAEDKWEEARKAFSMAADDFKEGFRKIGSLVQS